MNQILDGETKTIDINKIENSSYNRLDNKVEESINDIKNDLKYVDDRVDKEIYELNEKCNKLKDEITVKDRIISHVINLYDRAITIFTLLSIIAFTVAIRFYITYPEKEDDIQSIVLLVLAFICILIMYIINYKFIKKVRKVFDEDIKEIFKE